MKKLYRKSTVHPSPPFISDQLAFLPAAILTLTAVLSLEDREVLAYLLSSSCSVSSGNFSGHRRTVKAAGGGDHPPSFNCSCFRCYMSYWVRWDSSPNRQLIHEIIDAFEDGLVVKSATEGAVKKNNNNNNKRERRSKKAGSNNNNRSGELNRCEVSPGRGGELGEYSESVEEEVSGDGGEDMMGAGGCGDEEGIEKGSVRKFVSFIGERIWSTVWV